MNFYTTVEYFYKVIYAFLFVHFSYYILDNDYILHSNYQNNKSIYRILDKSNHKIRKNIVLIPIWLISISNNIFKIRIFICDYKN